MTGSRFPCDGWKRGQKRGGKSGEIASKQAPDRERMRKGRERQWLNALLSSTCTSSTWGNIIIKSFFCTWTSKCMYLAMVLWEPPDQTCKSTGYWSTCPHKPGPLAPSIWVMILKWACGCCSSIRQHSLVNEIQNTLSEGGCAQFQPAYFVHKSKQ